MPQYTKKAQQQVEKVMRKYKKGELKSGSNGKIVTNPEQTIAIGLSEARKTGEKIPPVKGGERIWKNKETINK